VVDKPIDHRGAVISSPTISPHALNGFVGGDDEAGAFLAAADEHQHDVRGLGIEWDVSDFVADQQRVALEVFELVIESALALAVGQESDPFGGRP
jgi:hypothetical protein